MQKRITVDELKNIIRARFEDHLAQQRQMQAHISFALGSPLPQQKPMEKEILNLMYDHMASCLAERLMMPPTKAPILTVEDLDPIIPKIVEVVILASGQDATAVQRIAIEKAYRTICQNIVTGMEALVPRGKNSYDEHWRWVDAVLDVTTERGIAPQDFAQCRDVADAVIRACLTRQEFESMTVGTVSMFIDEDAIVRMYIQPLLGTVAADLSDEDNTDLKTYVEQEVKPIIREQVAIVKPIVTTYLQMEVDRIYSSVA